MLSGKNILVGVTGGIAAYKSAFLVRLFKKAGANVKVVMTPDAVEFITPLTLSTLSENQVYTQFTDEETGEWENHVDLGLWADLFVVAPATANTMAKMATGVCDNFLLAVYLSAKCPVYVCPAMDLDMYKHNTTQENLKALEANGNTIIDAGEGELASGLVGKGRMEEPEQIVAFVEHDLKKGLPLTGKRVLITAGPTFEAIDPVRFIGNHSSGKMGYAIAEAAANLGAQVELVSGPSNESVHHSGVNIHKVTSAQEMFDQVQNHVDEATVIVMAAAVADYRPKSTSDVKIKKNDASLDIELEPTQDILAHVGAAKKEEQVLVGFALETNNELEHAKEKLTKKKLDLIVMNSLNDKGAGFGTDTNKVTLIDKDNNVSEFELKSKSEVAKDILNKILTLL